MAFALQHGSSFAGAQGHLAEWGSERWRPSSTADTGLSKMRGTFVPMVATKTAELPLRREAVLLVDASMNGSSAAGFDPLARIACLDSEGIGEVSSALASASSSSTGSLGSSPPPSSSGLGIVLMDHNRLEPGVVRALGFGK